MRRLLIATAAFALACITVHSQPAPVAQSAPAEEACVPPETFLSGAAHLPNPDAWLPNTPAANIDTPKPHDPKPELSGDDCPFYKGAWQRFLIATQPDASGVPAFLHYDAIADLFTHPSGSLSGSGVCDTSGAVLPRLTGGIFQAKSHKILVDRFGNPVFYDIRLDKPFKDFIAQHKLDGITDQKEIPDGSNPADAFNAPPGVVEFKSAWQIANPAAPPPDYFTVKVCVPVLAVTNGTVDIVPGKWRAVSASLLALHVVYSLKGHPELIWSTFEHVGASGVSDIAGAAPANPSVTAGTDPVVCVSDFPLCAGGTKISDAKPKPPSDYGKYFDANMQSFVKGGVIFATPIYRQFPHSKTNGLVVCTSHDPDLPTGCKSGEDSQVAELNAAIVQRFNDLPALATDNRRHFRLAGAIWINRPDRDFRQDTPFGIDLNHTTDDDNEVLAGEGRLSSTAMESFTQITSPNCFSCHDSQRIVSDVGPVGAHPHVDAKLFNVSHILSKYLFDK